MTEKDKRQKELHLRFFTKDGMPLKVLSTSLGIALIAHAMGSAAPAGNVYAEAAGEAAASPDGAPKLVEWSTEEVKAYYDAYLDWNIPMLQEEEEEGQTTGSGSASGGGTALGGGTATGGGTTVIHSGFGWDDLMLYHLIFNQGNAYSSSAWHGSHTAYDYRTGKVYKPATYSSGTFQNKPVTGSAVKPKTSNTTGSITRRSTSSSPGGIGGNSSGYTSSSSGSSSSKSTGSSFGG
ncbi:hypothetical protein ACFSL6_06455 [Paenibacillus thailandensis]|uniref:Uncharacterized protein n=1 Tax=Paenibacillus thailandensis TaxID=393250 RepID=A0ABW5QTQ2_9BACL